MITLIYKCTYVAGIGISINLQCHLIQSEYFCINRSENFLFFQFAVAIGFQQWNHTQMERLIIFTINGISIATLTTTSNTNSTRAIISQPCKTSPNKIDWTVHCHGICTQLPIYPFATDTLFIILKVILCAFSLFGPPILMIFFLGSYEIETIQNLWQIRVQPMNIDRQRILHSVRPGNDASWTWRNTLTEKPQIVSSKCKMYFSYSFVMRTFLLRQWLIAKWLFRKCFPRIYVMFSL